MCESLSSGLVAEERGLLQGLSGSLPAILRLILFYLFSSYPISRGLVARLEIILFLEEVQRDSSTDVDIIE